MSDAPAPGASGDASASTLPVLYSFRRCPYAMRARMALAKAGIRVRLREIILRDKPQEMLEASPKGSVPVLVLADRVIDESYDVMLWALRQRDAGGWLLSSDEEARALDELITENDGPFKHHLDRYKYAARYEGADAEEHRRGGSEILLRWDGLLSAHGGGLLRPQTSLADIALFPFVRQFRIADPDWFDAQAWTALQAWLGQHCENAIFASVMKKYPLWKETGEEHLFPPTDPPA